MVTNWTHSEAKYGFRLQKKYCITLRSEGQRLPHRTHKPGVGGSNPPLATKKLTLEYFWSQIGHTQKQIILVQGKIIFRTLNIQ